MADSLKKNGFHIGAKSMNYVKSEKFDSQHGMLHIWKFSHKQHTEYSSNIFRVDFIFAEGEYLSYAFGIISEYLMSDLCEKLSTRLGFEKIQAIQPGKRKSLAELDHRPLKRIKSEEHISESFVEPAARPSTIAPEKKQSAKDAKMAKAASGTKSISSFFMKK